LPFYALPRDPPRSTPFPYTTLFRSVGVAVMTALMLRAVPPRPGDPHATVRRELTALRQPQVIVAVLTGMVGFGGVFAMYSYVARSEEHTSELQSRENLVCRLLLEKK